MFTLPVWPTYTSVVVTGYIMSRTAKIDASSFRIQLPVVVGGKRWRVWNEAWEYNDMLGQDPGISPKRFDPCEGTNRPPGGPLSEISEGTNRDFRPEDRSFARVQRRVTAQGSIPVRVQMARSVRSRQLQALEVADDSTPVRIRYFRSDPKTSPAMRDIPIWCHPCWTCAEAPDHDHHHLSSS